MKFLKIVGVIILAFILWVAAVTYPKLVLISGFAAKSTASAHFIDGRDILTITHGDNDIPLVNYSRNTIDEAAKSASSSVWGMQERTAIYRDGLGAVLINDSYDPNEKVLVPKRNHSTSILEYPYGDNDQKDTLFANVDYGKLKNVIDNNFDKKGFIDKRSRGILVIYKDHIIGEQYGLGFNKDSKLLGWSMTKSITSTIFGILQYQGKYDINKPAPVAEWKNDKRAKITTNDLLHMNSGLEWTEQYDQICDATKMLFEATDMGSVQLNKPAVSEPNTAWNYSSGTTNLLSGMLRRQFNSQQEYLDFWYSALIDKIGMQSMVVETDLSGHYVGSSYAWATTRDWAKFGTLYLHEGNWNGEQIFDKSWAKYVATPTNTSDGYYGAHFWLNAGGKYPSAPKDMYYASGFQGQKIFIIPSKDMIIVRMGLTDDSQFDFDGLLRDILGSVK